MYLMMSMISLVGKQIHFPWYEITLDLVEPRIYKIKPKTNPNNSIFSLDKFQTNKVFPAIRCYLDWFSFCFMYSSSGL